MIVFEDPDGLRERLNSLVPPPSLLLVDFDGVVLDSEAIQHLAYSAALRPYGIELSTDDFRRYIGSSEDQVLERIQRDHACGLDLASVKAHRAIVLDTEFAAIAAPNWFVRPVLEWIALRRGTAQIVSAGHRNRIAATLDRFGLADFVDAIHTVPEQRPGTTKVDLLDRCIGTTPATTIVIEDNAAILAHASGRGCRTIGVRHAYNTDNELAADLTVSAQAAG